MAGQVPPKRGAKGKQDPNAKANQRGQEQGPPQRTAPPRGGSQDKQGKAGPPQRGQKAPARGANAKSSAKKPAASKRK